jgi:RNA polymerase sigma-70 factor (ECF subfamily)
VNDAELIARAQKGDSKAMNELLGKLEQRVYRFGLRMCGNEDDAREVLQETLLATFKNLATFRGDAQLSTWLYQVARSFCLKQRRRHEGEPATHESTETPEVKAIASETAASDSRAHARQVGEVIQVAMQALPAEHREALVLRDVEGLSYEEIAQAVGDSVPAIKSRLHRARLALRAAIDRFYAERAS